MKRRSFLAALAAIPVVGKLVQAEESTVNVGRTAVRLTPERGRLEVVYDREWDNPLGGIMQFGGVGARWENEYLPRAYREHMDHIAPRLFTVYSLLGPHTIPDFAHLQRVTIDHGNQTVLATYRPRRGAPGVEYTKAVPVDQ